MRRLIVSAILLAALAVVAPAVAAAPAPAPPENPNGWGTVVSQFTTATDPATLGEHSAGQATPRRGVGNVSRDPALNDLDNGHPGGHGCFVAGVDGVPATDCQGQPGTAR